MSNNTHNRRHHRMYPFQKRNHGINPFENIEFANNANAAIAANVGNSSSNSNKGAFWGNFSNISNDIGALFNNVASGLSSIIGAKNTTVNYTADPYQQSNKTGLYIGLGVGAIVLVVVLLFAFKKR